MIKTLRDANTVRWRKA